MKEDTKRRKEGKKKGKEGERHGITRKKNWGLDRRKKKQLMMEVG